MIRVSHGPSPPRTGERNDGRRELPADGRRTGGIEVPSAGKGTERGSESGTPDGIHGRTSMRSGR